MIDPAAFDALLERYLNGELSEAEGRELAEVLKTHPAAQAAFDRALYDEALLQAAHRPKPDAQRLSGTATP
ncbi:MAG: hypothetical protein KIS92_09850, partial [Planctomycetota bacterium]|nr:hypothetical protein [Planctomycetota bacterium]